MEQNPFQSSSEDEDSSTLESLEESEEKDTKKSKKRRIPLFDLKDKEAEAPESVKQRGRESLFGGMIVSGEKEDADHSNEQEVGADASAERELTEQFEEVVDDRLHAVEEELVTAASVDDATESLASVDFLETVSDRLDEGEPPELAIDSAVEEHLDIPTDADPEEVAEFLDAERLPEPLVEADEEDPTVPVLPTAAAAVVYPAARSRSAASSGAHTSGTGGAVPPPPPVGGAGRRMPSAGPPYVGASYNTVPTGTGADRDPNVVQMNEFYYRNRRSGDLLLGGVVGYLLGKRRGRIKTEKKLQPEIANRDKKLDELKDKLQASEAQIRSAALEHQQKTARAAEAHEKQLHEEKSKKESSILPRHIDTIQEEKRAFLAREQAFEQQLSDTEPSAPTSVAEVLLESAAFLAAPAVMKTETVSAEQVVNVSKPEAPEVKKPTTPEKRTRDVRFMRLSELLEVAESIPVGASNLREVYAGKQLDVVNLRRIITEYAKGAPVDKLIENSMQAYELRAELRHEIKTEDPQSTVALSSLSIGGMQTEQTTGQPAGRSDADQSATTQDSQVNLQQGVSNETEPEVLIANGTAIILGVLAGIGIMLFYLLVVQ